FVHHTMPLTRDVPSFVEWIKRPYKRIAGLDTVSRDEVVVFNFPAGDSVALIEPQQNYYELCRRYGREYINRNSKVIYRPVDKRENYIKRCVAFAGDTLQIIKGQVFVNGEPQVEIPGRQFMYEIQTSTPINPHVFDRMRIAKADVMHSGNMYYLPLTDSMAREIKALGNVVAMNKMALDQPSSSMFPHNVERYPWSEDMYGPLWVPRKGATVALSLDNLPLYERIIDVYENHDLKVENGVIYIDGKVADSYTFEMNYYFMMGDNRHNSADSRYWGFVPEDHVVGRASFVWLSLDKERSLFDGKIRFGRMFRKIK
ncbi:MAG: signal peptidase I, partial [Rikenellaceae bacterium]|nr:signal peptidase I [Rikenellaceae bacterium]